MKLLLLLPLLPSALAASSFAGSNNYYAWALPDADRHALLDGMKAAGMKVLLRGLPGSQQGRKQATAFLILLNLLTTRLSTIVPDLEAKGIGSYDDTVLNRIDQLMVDAHDRGIKLLIGMHDVNALKGGDIYEQIYGESGFYTNSAAINNFNQRITHILNGHKNALLGNQPWSELGGHIFGYEPQNEPMIFDQSLYTSHLSWICNAAQQIRNNVGDKNQLIFTGGGSAGASVQSAFFSSSCAIDVVAIHDYTDGYDSYMPSAISQAKSAGKKLIVEEWGSLVGSGRTANLNSNAQKINNYQVPWLYWQLITNADPHQGEDYEIDVGGTDWSTIEGLAQATGKLTSAPFDFSASLAL